MKQSELQTLLSYSPESGLFAWNVVKGRRGLPGKTAGTLNQHGYVCITIDGKKLKAHRLAWLYVYGEEPRGEIDHINRDRKDNRIGNLRVVDSKLNKENKLKLSNNKSGFKGVSWHEKAGKWQAHVRTNKRSHYLGLFHSPKDAYAAYQAAAARMHSINPCSESAL